MRVLMAMSGGVDSSVAALKLKEEGHELVGAMMRIYKGENKCDALNSCYGISKEKEICDAKEVCKKLGIDFHLIDCENEFQELVFKEFRELYQNGKTPNPCVLCNPRIKFGALPDIARNLGIDFDKFATGHYANIDYCPKLNRYLLKRGGNPKKDQSYFLYGLSQEQLSRTIFPLGRLLKEEVREIALQNGLITHDKKDSQDFFKGDYNNILDIPLKKGEIVLQDGALLGHHQGIHHFTIGQRKGIGIAFSEPLYVLRLDKGCNRVIVGTKEETFSNGLLAKNPNWIAFEHPPKNFEAMAKHRSTQEPQKCYVETIGNDNIKVVFEEPQNSVTPGQSVVFFDSDMVLGGATIEETI